MPAKVAAHAAQAWPLECCGLVLADGTVRRCANVHPAPRTAFALSAADALFLARSMDGPNPARVLYHSHPCGPAALSAADLALAARHPRLALLVVVPSRPRPWPR